MTDGTISRWAPRYVGVAVCALVLWQLLTLAGVLGYGYLLAVAFAVR